MKPTAISLKQNQVEQKTQLEDDAKEPIGHLIEHRLPWLTLGLFGGMITAVIVSKYESVLSGDIRLAFFLPIIVYMSDAVGTQTETIYVRHLAKKGAGITGYLAKEILLGLGLGLIFGVALAVFAHLWLHSIKIAWTVGLAMFINVLVAPVLALAIPTILAREHTDPALGAGPFATILQDLISILIYFFIATVIIF